MNVVIDCFKLVKGAGKSIGIYNFTKDFVNILSKEQNRSFDITVLGNIHNKVDFDLPGINFVLINKNPLKKLTFLKWELFTVNKFIKKHKANLVIFPRGFSPFFNKVKSLIVVHDLIPFYYHENFPGYFNKLESFYIRTRLLASIKSTNKVITVSNYSKEQVIKKLPTIDKNKIIPIQNGFSPVEYNKSSIRPKDYILTISSNLPHKNFISLLTAYEEYCNKTKSPFNLVVIGIKNPEQYSSLVSEDVFNRITFTGYISDNEIVNLMKETRLFIFLSLIEGFGFPPLEAMNFGIPVISSGTTSLKEITEGYALTVNPLDTLSISDKIIEVLENENLYKELSQKGLENIKRFRWEDKIKEYINVIENLLVENNEK